MPTRTTKSGKKVHYPYTPAGIARHKRDVKKARKKKNG
jgi:hypothetical protein|tara:strand:+ start:41 stop:154 length:114 start_codon:yes stop_codon:yes gene_type:complete